MKSNNSEQAKQIAINLLNEYKHRLNMINDVLNTHSMDVPHTIFVKWLRTPKSYYNAVNKSITLVFVPNHRFSVHTQGRFTDHWFDNNVYSELEKKDNIYNAEWEHQNKMIPLEDAIDKLLEQPFTNIEVIKLDF